VPAFERSGLSSARLGAVTYAQLNNPTRRPMYSPLRNTTFEEFGVAPLLSWSDALDAFLAQRRERMSAVTG
jgi:dTDP-4-dehydrorhamnose reductase